MIDLTKCKTGDKLRRRDGEIVEYYYLHTGDPEWPHVVKYYNHTTHMYWQASYQEIV